MKVSVCPTTYNHVSYIRQAIEGVLRQRTGRCNFSKNIQQTRGKYFALPGAAGAKP